MSERPSLELAPREMAADRTLVINTDAPLDLTFTDSGTIWIRGQVGQFQVKNARCIYIDPRPPAPPLSEQLAALGDTYDDVL